ncbi:hypothetical protein CPC08DRAFT_803284 [Agrocybe pediades]|nr:hypothetical protein CPC08DRAFT_803284 [Agrocybe pediades]
MALRLVPNHTVSPSRNVYSRLDESTRQISLQYQQWETNVRMLMESWRTVRNGLSLSFFQIDGVSDDIVSRTAALSALILSGIGLISTTVYHAKKSSLMDRRARQRWIKASHDISTPEALRFWFGVAYPAACLAWYDPIFPSHFWHADKLEGRSLLGCITAIINITVIDKSNSLSDSTGTVVSAYLGTAFLVSVLLFQSALFYLANKFVFS